MSVRENLRWLCNNPAGWWRYGRPTPFADFRAFWQRGRRGWANRDTWSLDMYLAEWLPDALRHLAAHTHGVPTRFAREDGGVDLAGWRAELEAIAAAFEEYAAKAHDPAVDEGAWYAATLARMRALLDDDVWGHLWD